MKFDSQRQLCNGKLNYKIYYYDHDIRGYLICSSHKFSPFGRVGVLTFCYCYWQFVVSFLLSGAEGQRGKQSASKKEIHRERGTARGESADNLCARLGWLYEILLIIAERQPAQTYLNYFHFNCKHTHKSIHSHIQTQKQRHTHIHNVASGMAQKSIELPFHIWNGHLSMNTTIEGGQWGGRGRVRSVKRPHKYVALAWPFSTLHLSLNCWSLLNFRCVEFSFPFQWAAQLATNVGDGCCRSHRYR